MTCILFQRGATSLGFQIGWFELSLVYPRYWGNLRHPNLFHFHIWRRWEI